MLEDKVKEILEEMMLGIHSQHSDYHYDIMLKAQREIINAIKQEIIKRLF